MKSKTTGSGAGSAASKESRTHNISIRVTESLYREAAQAAQRDARSMANWIEILIVRELGAATPPRRGVRIVNKAERATRIKEGLRAIKAQGVLEEVAAE